MTWRQFGSTFDARVNQMTERATRRMSRRNILRTVFVSGAASIAAVSIGETPALADDCTSHCGPTPRCSHCRPTEWPQGLWIACNGLGHGYGYKMCKDCIFRHRCRDWCTCLTECVCCGCRTAADFKAEQHRIQLSESNQ